MLITTINCTSVRLTSAIQVIFTFFKISLIVAIVATGLANLADGQTSNFAAENAFTATSVSAVAVAFYSGLFSYDGW